MAGKHFAGMILISRRAKLGDAQNFKDRQGRIWDVWQVHPSASERRFAQRRVLDDDRTGAADQRSGLDRRGGHRKNARAPVAAEFAYGWLCFETVGEKRRLAPVPADWGRADDETIEQWCCVANPALRRKTGEILGSGGAEKRP